MRRVGARLLLLWLALAAAAAAEPLTTGVAAIGFTVADADRSADFYSRVLDFERLDEREAWGSAYDRLQGVFGVRMRVVRMRLGDEVIELTEYLTPRGRAVPADSRSNDLWFQHIAIVVRDMEAGYRRLRAAGVEQISNAPQRLPDWNPNAGGIEAYYFRDPDGHALELIHFPPGKGDERWQQPTGRLFLGIDHTAIAVADTERSRRFYRDLLGFELAGESENWGDEQEHLNSVFGARLRISGLRPPAGPAIELLEYLAPRTGRPAPWDLEANDLAHWQTTLRVRELDAAARAVRQGAGRWVSPGPVELEDAALGFERGMLVRDPDGHGLRLIDD